MVASQGILYSLLAGISTIIGTLIVISLGKPKRKALAGLLGFAAGIMLSISTFELMQESVEFSSAFYCVLGFLLGAGLLNYLNLLIFQMHPKTLNENDILKIGYLLLIGIALHNFPEGLAIGAGLEACPELGLFVAISIGIHNIPEGIATAGPLKAGGLNNYRIVLWTLCAGLMAPLGTITGMTVFGLSPRFIGLGLAFASGAMLYIVFDELIPRAHKFNPCFANSGIILGFLLGFVITH